MARASPRKQTRLTGQRPTFTRVEHRASRLGCCHALRIPLAGTQTTPTPLLFSEHRPAHIESSCSLFAVRTTFPLDNSLMGTLMVEETKSRGLLEHPTTAPK